MTSRGIVESILGTLSHRVSGSFKIHAPVVDTPVIRQAIRAHVRGDLTWEDLWTLVDTLPEPYCESCEG
jgi:hypothetical protein